MKLRKLIAVFAAVLLAVSAMPLSAFAQLGGDFPWTEPEDQMLIEQILERDGFIDGIWFPWFDGGRCGHNLTGNDVMAEYYNPPKTSDFIDWNCVELDRRGADTIYRQIYNLKAMGYNIMAYAGSIYGEGVIYDAYGDVLGIKQEYLDNARRLLDMCREIGMPVMWNVYFHCSTTPDYYGIDGWNITCRMLGDPTVADHYAERFVKPLCKMLAEYPDVVALVSIADEPENEINDSGKGNHFSGGRVMYGVTQEDMLYFMQQINETVREELPGVARTVASNYGNKAIYRDFDLDLMGHHEYNNNDSILDVDVMFTDADPILTEYNIGGDVYYNDEQFAQKLINFRESMMNKGYKGGFQWCWLPSGYATSSSGWSGYLLRNESDATSFRKTVTLLKYYMDEYRAAYRGETVALDAPVLYANDGTGKVLFIPSKRATNITIQRSDDGGTTWKDLVTNVSQSRYVNTYLIGTYKDTTAPKSGYCYRILASDGVNTAVSEPNNVAGTETKFKKTYVAPAYRLGKCYQYSTQSQANAKLTSFGVEKNRPASAEHNLIVDGSFETGMGQWDTSSFLQYASVVTDATAPDGDKSLYFDTSNRSQAGWYTFTVNGLEKNTNYTFSAWLKGAYLASDNKGMASLGVIDPDSGKFMVYWEYYRYHQRASRDTQQLYPTAWDDEWHLRSVSFNSQNRTSVTIALYGYSSKMWVDGLALFRSNGGVKYNNGESAQAQTIDKWEDLSSTATNAVADPDINDVAYWSAGAGYKQGFVSVADGKLNYTASSDPHGVRYTKWVDVKPGTDYYYSFTVNVTKTGGGRVAILDSAKTLPHEVVTASFSSVGTKTYQGRISTGAYQRLGLCVVDLGGVATIDNVSFYEVGESASTITQPSFDGFLVNGNFEIGSADGWENLWNGNKVTMVEGRSGGCAMRVTAGKYTHMRQFVNVRPNTDYVIELWVKDVVNAELLVKNSADTIDIMHTAFPSGSNWTLVTVEFNSGSNLQIIVSLMGDETTASYTVDDIVMRGPAGGDDDSYILNGDFEIGSIDGWENLWDANAVSLVAGLNSRYAIQVNAGLYTHVRQLVAVKPYTDYRIDLWSKNAVSSTLLVKNHADTYNIMQVSLSGSSQWSKTALEFNSGDNEFVYVSLMGEDNGATYTVDNVEIYRKDSSGLMDGGFERGGQHWLFQSGAHAIVSDAHSGNKGLQLTNPGVWGEAACQTFAVEPATNYTITWWYKATTGTGTFNLFTMDGVSFDDMTATGTGKNYMEHYTGGWQKGVYVVNAGASTSMLLKFSTQDSTPGTILIDDVMVRKEGEACLHDYVLSSTQQPTCTDAGARIYTCGYCDHTYTEPLPAIGSHTYDSVCDSVCNQCNAQRVVPHRYNDDFDESCNLCGAVREIALPITFGGNSTHEEVSGLAFRFDVTARGVEKDGFAAVYQNATVNGYKLVRMGALVANDYDSKDIPAVNLLDSTETTASFAVRVVEIPAHMHNSTITATPYIVVEIDGVETTIYGETQACTYNQAIL